MTATVSPGITWQRPEEYYRTVLSNPWYRTVALLQNTITELTVDFWRSRGAQTLHLPVTTGSISSPMGRGSDSSPVSVDLLGAETFLADSMQFMLEFGCRVTGTDTYYVMPSFRGESADTTHLCQFFHSEAEVIGDLEEVLTTVERYLTFLADGIVARHAGAVRAAGGDIARIEKLATEPRFERLTFDEAAALLNGDGIVDHGGWRTLARHGEALLLDKVGPFVWVTDWDHLAVPFYQAFGSNPARARNADLLFGMGEIVGAGERHESADDVARALTMHEVDSLPYEWYMEMRKTQPLRTAGFGLGIERFMMWLLDHDDIRDMQLMPRQNGVNIVP